MKALPVLGLTIMVAYLTWPVAVTLPSENRSLEELESVLPTVEPVKITCHIVHDGGEDSIQGEKCTSIKNITFVGTNLTLRDTGLVSLGPGDFAGFPQLTSLTIMLNKQLEEIENGTFEDLKNLVYLSITLSRTQVLGNDVFQGLVNLRYLKIVRGGVQSFSFISVVARPEILPSLITLDVSENAFLMVITNEDTRLMNGSTVQNFYLNQCSITWIDPDALNVFASLQNLSMGNNKMSNSVVIRLLESLSNAAPNLTSFNIQSNLIVSPYGILSTVASTSIEWLDVSRSSYSVLMAIDCNYSLPFMPQVQYLDLTSSLPVSQTSLFLGSETLPQVEHLYLGSNWFFVNPLTVSLPKLKLLDLSSNSPPNERNALEKDQFILENCTYLEELNLSHNPARALRRNFVKGAHNLNILRLVNASLEEIEPFALSHLVNLEILDLGHNKFHTTKNLNRTSFSGLISLLYLNLENSFITCIDDESTFDDLLSLKWLNLKQNRLLDLRPHLLDHVIKLEYLDLSFNTFQSWDYRIFDGSLHLKVLDLNENQLTVFHPAMISDLTVPELINLMGNPFSCECSDLAVITKFLNSPNSEGMALLDALKQPNTYCATPASLRFASLFSYANSSFHTGECLEDGATAVIVLTVCILLVVILVGTTASYFLRWHIKYWIFLLRQFFAGHIFPKKKDPSNDGIYKYDAFVSYSNEDRGFVVRLVSMLESHAPYYRLCVFERDFEVGGVITDNVVDSLAKSKRTILILSDAYAKSTWCQWELQLAQHKRLFFKDDRHGPLIIIKIGEIMDKHMTPTLRYLIKTRIYLQWNSDPIKQKVFWEKLRSALSASLDDDEESRPDLQQVVLSKNGSKTTHVVEKVETLDSSSKPDQTTEE